MSKKQVTIEEKMNRDLMPGAEKDLIRLVNSAPSPEGKASEKALVPEAEQPYQLPDNWCWVYLLDGYAECLDKYRKPVNSSERAERIGEIPYYGATGQVGLIDDYLTDEQLVLLGEDGAPFLDLFKDKAYIIEGKAWVNNHAHILRSYYGSTGNKFLFHYLNQFNYKGYVNGTTRLKLTQASMANIPIVFPPIPEQHRIVARIESLFAKLDEAKEKIKNVLEGAEKRKAAILHKAFTGQLTANWRKENGVLFQTWEKQKLSEIGSLERGRSKHRPRNDPKLFGGEYPFIQTGDIATAEMYVTLHKQTLSEIGLQQSRLFPAGTLCITIAANIGEVAILSYDCCFPDSVVGFLPYQEKAISEYVYYLMSIIQKELEAKAPATAQKNINLKLLNDVEIDVPSLPEQQEIVHLLDNFLAKEKSIVATCEKSLATIEQMKKSILAKAFRGELGTNDPGEESALTQ